MTRAARITPRTGLRFLAGALSDGAVTELAGAEAAATAAAGLGVGAELGEVTGGTQSSTTPGATTRRPLGSADVIALGEAAGTPTGR